MIYPSRQGAPTNTTLAPPLFRLVRLLLLDPLRVSHTLRARFSRVTPTHAHTHTHAHTQHTTHRGLRERANSTDSLLSGFGLSLSNWTIGSSVTQQSRLSIATDGSETQTVSITMTNKGPFVGDVVVAAFLVPKNLTTQKDIKLRQKLWGFERGSDIQVGGSATFDFEVSASSLAIEDVATGDYVSAPGDYELRFEDGAGGSEHEQTMLLRISGEQQVIEPFPVV